MAATLDDAWAKVEWAYRHLERLHRRLKRFNDDGPYIVSEEPNPEGTHRILTAIAKPIDSEVGHIFSDIVHALHASLDYVVCSFVESVGKTVTKKHAFPIFVSRELYNSQAPAMLRHVPYELVKLVEHLQPYHAVEQDADGPYGQGLDILYELSIEEKHRALLLALSQPRIHYVGHDGAEGEPSGIEFRMSPAYDKAKILLPIDPNKRFDPHFTATVVLAREGPHGTPLVGLAHMLYNRVGHYVLPEVERLGIVRLTNPRHVPFVFDLPDIGLR